MRVTDFSEIVADQIAAVVLDGESFATAAEVTGVPRSILENWYLRGKRKEEPFVYLYEKCRPADDLGRMFRPEVREALLQSLRKGMPARVAASLAGVPWSTFSAWMTLGAEDVAPYAKFYEQTLHSRHKIANKWQKAVNTAIEKGDGRLGLDMLTRTFPNDYDPHEAAKIKIAKEKALKEPVATVVNITNTQVSVEKKLGLDAGQLAIMGRIAAQQLSDQRKPAADDIVDVEDAP